MLIAIAILVVAIVVAMAFGRWLQRKGARMEKGDDDASR